MRRKLAAGLTVVTLIFWSGTATADTEPAGEAGSALSVQARTDEGGNPVPNDVPMPTDENGNPLYLSQDGAGGQRASGVINQGVRDLIGSGNYNSWNLNFGETEESNATETIFWLTVDGERFRIVVSRDQ